MGTNNEETNGQMIFYYQESNGEHATFNFDNVTNVTLETVTPYDEGETYPLKSLPTECLFEVKLKGKNKITKRRFRKWLMGQGIMRDDADFLCRWLGLYQGEVSYKSIYNNLGLRLIFANTNPDLRSTLILKEIINHKRRQLVNE